MPFEAFIDESTQPLEKKTKVLFPISLGQKYHAGERLKALMQLAKGYNATFLIADGLQQHNLGSLEKALALGTKFLEKHEETFKDTVLIESVAHWEKYQNDASVIKVVRWNMWAKIKAEGLQEANRVIEAECQKPASTLVKAMKEAAQHNLSAKTVESSIQYQTEENKYLLTFFDFDYHLYPAPLNASQAETYKLFNQQFKMPIHKHIKFKTIIPSEQASEQRHQRHAQSLPLAIRMVINSIEEVLKSTEISPQHKEVFVLKMQSMLVSMQHQSEATQNKVSTPDQENTSFSDQFMQDKVETQNGAFSSCLSSLFSSKLSEEGTQRPTLSSSGNGKYANSFFASPIEVKQESPSSTTTLSPSPALATERVSG